MVDVKAKAERKGNDLILHMPTLKMLNKAQRKESKK